MDSIPFHVALIPGHRPGASGAGVDGVNEWPLTYLLAEMTARRMQRKSGLKSYIYRRTKTGLAALIDRMNNNHEEGAVDVGLSLHFNATNSPPPVDKRHGYALHYPDAQDSRRLAYSVTSYVGSPGGDRKEPRSQADLAVLRDTAFPVVLDEPFFIDNYEVHSTALAHFPDLAQSYADALEHFARQKILNRLWD